MPVLIHSRINSKAATKPGQSGWQRIIPLFVSGYEGVGKNLRLRNAFLSHQITN